MSAGLLQSVVQLQHLSPQLAAARQSQQPMRNHGRTDECFIVLAGASVPIAFSCTVHCLTCFRQNSVCVPPYDRALQPHQMLGLQQGMVWKVGEHAQASAAANAQVCTMQCRAASALSNEEYQLALSAGTAWRWAAWKPQGSGMPAAAHTHFPALPPLAFSLIIQSQRPAASRPACASATVQRLHSLSFACNTFALDA